MTANIDALRELGQIPPGTGVQVHAGMTFEDAYNQIIGPRLRANPSVPAFALIDPFGWTGIPMRIVSELLHRPSTEVLINFMFEEINRFLSHPDQPSNFDVLFGTENCRKALQLAGVSRRNHIHDLYQQQLKTAAGARFVRSFEMRNDRGLIDYFLFFATNNTRGLAKMKEAMWRVDPGGSFGFSDTTDSNQSVLFEPEPDRELLRKLIVGRFAGIQVPVGEIERFVIEETPFLATHYKKVLAAMEAYGSVRPVNAPDQRRAGTFPSPNLILSFR